MIHSDGPPTFQSYARQNPPMLVVDLLDAVAPRQTPAPMGAIEQLRFKTVSGVSGKIARLSVRFTHAVKYDVTAKGNDVTLTLFEKSASVADPASFNATAAVTTKTDRKVAMAPTRNATTSDAGRPLLGLNPAHGEVGKATAPRLAQADGGNQMTYIGFRNSARESRIYARMNNETAEFDLKKEGENLLVLEIEDATIPLKNNKNYLDTKFFDSPVKMITPTEVEDAKPRIRIIIEMKEETPYETKRDGVDVVVIFKKEG